MKIWDSTRNRFLVIVKKAGDLGSKINSFKETIKGIPGVIHIVNSTAVPGGNNRSRMQGCKNEGDIRFWT